MIIKSRKIGMDINRIICFLIINFFSTSFNHKVFIRKMYFLSI